MKKVLTKLVPVIIGVSLVASCSTNTQRENTGAGAVTGAVVGGLASGLLGGNAAAIGITAIAGALIGGYIGHQMDSTDHAGMYHALDNNAPNKSTEWKNAKTGTVYKITPTSSRMTINGNHNCRNYRVMTIMNGKMQTSYGTACRQSDGSWVAVKA